MKNVSIQRRLSLLLSALLLISLLPATALGVEAKSVDVLSMYSDHRPLTEEKNPLGLAFGSLTLVEEDQTQYLELSIGNADVASDYGAAMEIASAIRVYNAADLGEQILTTVSLNLGMKVEEGSGEVSVYLPGAYLDAATLPNILLVYLPAISLPDYEIESRPMITLVQLNPEEGGKVLAGPLDANKLVFPEGAE